MPAKRQHLARLRRAAGHTQESLAEHLGVTRNTVVRWETGVAYPHAWHQRKLAKTLGISTHEVSQLIASEDLHPSQPATSVRPVAGGLAASSVADWELTDLLTRSPISMAALDAMEVAVFDYAARYPTTGPDGMVTAAQHQMTRLSDALAHPMPVAIRRRTVRLLGVLAGVIGHLYIDLAVPLTRTHHLFSLGRLAGAEAEDQDLVAWVMATESIAAFHDGQLTRTLDLLTNASALAAPTSSARRRAWIGAMRARALAAVRCTDDCQRELDRAYTLIDIVEAPTGNDFFDQTRLDGMTGQVMLLLGNTARADHILSHALDQRAPTDVKGRAMLTIDRAECRVATGDPAEGSHLLLEAVDLAADALVQPIVGRIKQVRGGMKRWDATRPVAELDERLTECLPTAQKLGPP